MFPRRKKKSKLEKISRELKSSLQNEICTYGCYDMNGDLQYLTAPLIIEVLASVKQKRNSQGCDSVQDFSFSFSMLRARSFVL